MRKQSVWRFVVQIVGASLALAGLICILIAHWDKLTAGLRRFFVKCMDICSCPELDDYADELLYE